MHFTLLLLSRFNCIQLFATLWTIAHQAPQSMEFPRQEYWSGLPCPPPEDIHDPGMEPASLTSLLQLQAGSLPLVSPGKPLYKLYILPKPKKMDLDNKGGCACERKAWDIGGLMAFSALCCEPQFSSVAQSCSTLCDPMNHSTPGLPVHHQLPEFTQTHIHRVSDAIQPTHPLSSPFPPAASPSQHQSLFQ